jgi:hypothetical protein
VKKTLLAFMLVLSLLCSSAFAAYAETEDPYFYKQNNLERINYDAVWEQGLDGRGVRIAIIDSGIYSEHEDLADSNILQGVNLIDRSTKTDDTSGHGTFIAAMLSAGRNNGTGIAGMVDKASIVPLKCFSSGRQTDARYIVSAIYMAVDEYNCDVINLSLGILEDVPALRQAVKYADEQGVIIVASAGNTGGTSLVYPAAYPGTVCVGSVSGRDKTSYFSQRNSSIYVVAPGEDIFSAGISAPDAYMEGSGTSFSSVHVTALAAVAKQHNPSIDCAQFKRLLRESAEDLGAEGYDSAYGWGIVNAPAFVELLMQLKSGFSDISGHWAENDIVKCVNYGLFSGVSEELFLPDAAMTRAAMVTSIYRLAGSPPVSRSNSFADVPAGKWYSAAAQWAAQTGVAEGDHDGNFNPEQSITRQELAVMLYRYAQFSGLDGTSSRLRFADSGKIAVWAKDAVSWCAGGGFITGRPGGTFAPEEKASRADAAAILVRFAEHYEL